MHNYRELHVWQRSMDLTVEIYRLSAKFPRSEQFGLISQIRRAATSIPLNIAEGSGSDSDREFCRFLRFSLRSCYETMTALEIARRLGYAADSEVYGLANEADEIAAMLNGLIKRLSE